jgi:hypothetical protein
MEGQVEALCRLAALTDLPGTPAWRVNGWAQGLSSVWGTGTG